jgi:hypothetical protein
MWKIANCSNHFFSFSSFSGEILPTNTDWILKNSVSDGNFDEALKHLTDEQLEYCLKNEKRKTALTKLQKEKRKREAYCVSCYSK